MLEKVRLTLAVEADLKPNAAVNLGNRLERCWLDFAVIQPGPDLFMVSPKAPGFLSTHTVKAGLSAISRSFLWPMRREHMGLSVGAASLVGRTDEARYRTFVGGVNLFFGRA